MDLTLYIIFSVVYIMVIHFAVNIHREFDVWFTCAFFVFTGFVGWYMNSYELAFAAGMILSLLLW